MLFHRLLGQETEYAIRFSPERRHPGNDVIFEALTSAISARVRTEPGMFPGRPQIFTENGGAFHYEYYPYCADGGLLEGATPECRGPAQLLLYQRAQEALLERVIPDAESRLRSSGFPGKLGLLKNCRDAEGHVYGAQESFEVDIARGLTLWLYRGGLVALLPLMLATVLAGWTAFIAIVAVVLLGALAASFVLSVPPLRGSGFFRRLLPGNDRNLERRLGRFFYYAEYLLVWPFIASFSALLRLVAFRRIRRQATAFLVTRPLISGAGTLDERGGFLLSEKALSIERLLRGSRPQDRAVYDTGNLMKPALAVAYFHLRPMLSLFRRKQRLQLGLADSNMLEEAEFLKWGATALVIDMAEAGALSDGPRLKRPIEALHRVASDPSLQALLETDRGPMTAVQIQKLYLERAESFVRESKATSIEALEVVRLWRIIFRSLERQEMDRLVGRIDWVTKRYLLESCGDRHDPDLLKTIDLRYHELDEGYAAKLLREGLARRILEPAEVELASSRPPRGTPAFTRGRFIRSREPSLVPVRISWDSARVGGRLAKRVVRFPSPAEGDRQ